MTDKFGSAPIDQFEIDYILSDIPSVANFIVYACREEGFLDIQTITACSAILTKWLSKKEESYIEKHLEAIKKDLKQMKTNRNRKINV